MYRMFYLGGNFVSSLICTLKSKKPKKLKTYLKNSKNTCFFPAMVSVLKSNLQNTGWKSPTKPTNVRQVNRTLYYITWHHGRRTVSHVSRCCLTVTVRMPSNAAAKTCGLACMRRGRGR